MIIYVLNSKSKIKKQDKKILEPIWIERSKDLTILKFPAEWCGPSQMHEPIYEETSSKYSDKLFGEIDIDDEESKSIVSK